MGASPDMLNITVFEGTIKKRMGYSNFKALGPLGLRITGLYATQDDEVNTHFIATHPTGVMKYNHETHIWDPMVGPVLTGDNRPMDFETSQNSIVFCQGSDKVMRHDIKEQNLTYDVLNDECPPARYLTRFADRLILAYTIENSGESKPFRIRRSISGNHFDWSGLGSGFTDMTEFAYHIKGIKKLGEQMAIFTERSVHIATRTGISTMPYEIQLATEESGALSDRAILAFPGQPGLIYLGSDDVYMFNGGQLQALSLPIRDQIFNTINPSAIRFNFAYLLLDTQEVAFFLCTGGAAEPNMVWVFNYARQVWYPWDVDGMTCATQMRQDDTSTIDELIGTIDEQNWEFDNRLLSSAYPALMTGGADGKVYAWSPRYLTDNGKPILSRWTSRDFEWDDLDPNMSPSRLTLRSLGVTYTGTGAACELDVSFSIDGGDHYLGPYPLMLTSDTGTRTAVLHKQITGDRIRWKIENSIGQETFRIHSFHPVFELRETLNP
jgi:hypothetical protein